MPTPRRIRQEIPAVTLPVKTFHCVFIGSQSTDFISFFLLSFQRWFVLLRPSLSWAFFLCSLGLCSVTLATSDPIAPSWPLFLESSSSCQVHIYSLHIISYKRNVYIWIGVLTLKHVSLCFHTGLSLVVGLVLYISNINDEMLNRTKSNEAYFSYKYGWSFAFAAISFLLTEVTSLPQQIRLKYCCNSHILLSCLGTVVCLESV